MSNDAKAFLLFGMVVIFMLGGMFIGISYTEGNRQECRMKAMELKYPAEQIAQICK